MDDESKVYIDDIRLWNKQQLKNSVRERNLPVSRRKEELVALVYAVKVSPNLALVVTTPAEAAAEKILSLAVLGRIKTQVQDKEIRTALRYNVRMGKPLFKSRDQ